MQFTYNAYRKLLILLQNKGYAISSYHNWKNSNRSAILRHDIDNSIELAVRMGEVEQDLNIQSTYFVLLRTDLYNAASQHNSSLLRNLQSMGHEIGLHFDEKAYPEGTVEETTERIMLERDILAMILGTPVTTVSMHRPSKTTLDSNIVIPGMVNSYSKIFFHHFKYLSDSRRHWREPVEDIVSAGTYDRLHILTHAFWYKEQEEDIATTVGNFIRAANGQRYEQMRNNLTDFTKLGIKPQGE